MLSEASVCDETQESGSDHRFHTVGILGGAQLQRLDNERKVYGDCDTSSCCSRQCWKLYGRMFPIWVQRFLLTRTNVFATNLSRLARLPFNFTSLQRRLQSSQTSDPISTILNWSHLRRCAMSCRSCLCGFVEPPRMGIQSSIS